MQNLRLKIENKDTVDVKVDEFDNLLDINGEATNEHQIDSLHDGKNTIVQANHVIMHRSFIANIVM